jgi:hypothetical protein
MRASAGSKKEIAFHGNSRSGWRMRTVISILLLSGSLLYSEEAAPSDALKKTIDGAGENASQIRSAWEKCPVDQRMGMEFLLVNMPTHDAKTLQADFLLENVALAFRARNEMPWGREIPEEIFLNDVLPYACLDESRDSWRADFFNRFRAIAGDAQSAHEALKRVNSSMIRETGVRYSTKRRVANQGPKESMELKMASCTGLSILLADALRSICIPTRITGTAMWTNNKGNHNWNEVWLPEYKQWKFTEYGNNSEELDRGWLLGEAAKAVPGSLVYGVYATTWKKSANHFPMVWNDRDTSVTAVEVSQRYIELGAPHLQKAGECELQIEAVKKSADGSPMRESVEVEVLQDGKRIAKGATPSATDDTNHFLCVRVPQGAPCRVVVHGSNPRSPSSMEEVTPKEQEKNRRITLHLP